MTRVAIVSAIYGGYDKPKPLPELIADDVRYRAYLFTDSEDVAREASDLGWIGVLDENPGWFDVGDYRMSSMLKAKFIKTHMHMFTPTGTDVLIWLDGSMTITNPNFVNDVILSFGTVEQAFDILFTPHPLRTCIYPEAQVTKALARYADVDPIAQVEYYRSIGHPVNWGLFASGCFAILNNAITQEWGGHWWNECFSRTYQDQLSLPVITRIMQERGLRWNSSLPWGKWWGITEHGF